MSNGEEDGVVVEDRVASCELNEPPSASLCILSQLSAVESSAVYQKYRDFGDDLLTFPHEIDEEPYWIANKYLWPRFLANNNFDHAHFIELIKTVLNDGRYRELIVRFLVSESHRKRRSEVNSLHSRNKRVKRDSSIYQLLSLDELSNCSNDSQALESSNSEFNDGMESYFNNTSDDSNNPVTIVESSEALGEPDNRGKLLNSTVEANISGKFIWSSCCDCISQEAMIQRVEETRKKAVRTNCTAFITWRFPPVQDDSDGHLNTHYCMLMFEPTHRQV